MGKAGKGKAKAQRDRQRPSNKKIEMLQGGKGNTYRGENNGTGKRASGQGRARQGKERNGKTEPTKGSRRMAKGKTKDDAM